MAYNPFPAYNPYPQYPQNSYQQQYAQPQQPYIPPQNASYQQSAQANGMCWVDGEIGAKAQPFPPGWDPTKPYPMWDTNDQIIYLKSCNAMGMPNPLTKLHYTVEEPSKQAPMMSSQAALPAAEQHPMPDMSDFVRKEDMAQMEERLKAAMIAQADAKGARANGKSAV